MCSDGELWDRALNSFNGELSPNLLSEMSLPGIEVLIEKLFTQNIREIGKENHSKRRCKVSFVQRKCAVTSSVSVLEV